MRWPAAVVLLALGVVAAAAEPATKDATKDLPTKDAATGEAPAREPGKQEPGIQESWIQESWTKPRTTTFQPDWAAARAAIPVLPPSLDRPDRLAALTALAADVFPGVARSPVPVLLPFAVADYAHDRAADLDSPADSHMADFQPTRFFLAGPTGYDATFTLSTRTAAGFEDIAFADPVVVQISAFARLYDLPAPAGAIPLPAGELEKEVPGLKRQILESTLHYSFERFGIPYIVSIQCFDGPQRRLRLACRNAERVAARFMRALRLAGGNPALAPAIDAPAKPDAPRPEAVAADFRYLPPGKLLRGTAMRAASGDDDRTVYASLRFPLAEAPAFIHSQTFGRRKRAQTEPAANGAYVWRDNFCERRHFFVGQCPSGLGHQGQDIRGASCDPRTPSPAGCQPERDAVVAARDGMILREPWNDSFFLVTNEAGERLRFRYLHMHPRKLDAEGIMSGRLVRAGDPLGSIGNFNRRPGLTSTHLHFEIHVPTRDGWLRVNPFMTLVAAYEHLIGARGVEIEEMEEAEPQPDVVAVLDTGPGAAETAIAAASATASLAGARMAQRSEPAETSAAKPRAKHKSKFRSKRHAQAAAANKHGKAKAHERRRAKAKAKPRRKR